ncbi:MAG TPA: Clp protease N-terminal domain-containing protein, partial [Solirubrobacteraceae bacterium]|nr:Clp protease N-terminal domain-containing protein [Solirubrobacteraceae bacterium]
MQPDRLTIRAQEAVAAAARLASDRRNPQIAPEHLLAALLDDGEGIAVSVLRKLGADVGSVRRALDAGLAGLPVAQGTAEEPVAASELVTVLRAADGEARKLGDDYVSTEHL